MFAIGRPEVYKSSNSDTYIVFGEVQVEDLRARAQAAAAQQLAAEAAAKAEETEANTTSTTAEAGAAAAPEEEEDEGEVDATGVEEKDIELVVSQANVSRNKAIKALKNNNNDIVNAIMVSLLFFRLDWHVYDLHTSNLGIDHVKFSVNFPFDPNKKEKRRELFCTRTPTVRQHTIIKKEPSMFDAY